MNYNEVKSNLHEYLKQNNENDIRTIFDSEESKNKLKEATANYLINTNNEINIEETAKILFNDLFGLGIIEEIVEDENITDISYNGKSLWVQSNVSGRRLYERQISEYDAYIIIEKIANQAQKQFNVANPILDVEYETIRINAIHESISPDGRSFSIRIVSDKIKINNENFPGPDYIEKFLKDKVGKNKNIIISGQTGSGKSELQKYLVKYINQKDKIVLISDNNELKLSKLYPDKDIYTWITRMENFSSIKIDFSDLIKPALRYNPEWLIISESRGPESFDMINAATTGHNIITTLHAQNAIDIPTRLLNMSMQKFNNINEMTMLKNIYQVLDYGIHLETIFSTDGKIVRQISQIVKYGRDFTCEVLYEKGKVDKIKEIYV